MDYIGEMYFQEFASVYITCGKTELNTLFRKLSQIIEP